VDRFSTLSPTPLPPAGEGYNLSEKSPKKVYFEEALWQWMALVITLAFAGIVVVLLILWSWRWDKAQQGEGALWQLGQPLVAVGICILTAVIARFIGAGINITGGRLLVIDLVLTIVSYAALAWLAGLVITRTGQFLIAAQHLRETNLNTALIRISFRIVAILVVVYVAVYGLGRLGIPLAPLLAGLGVGGLAIALAVRPMIENILGGFTLFRSGRRFLPLRRQAPWRRTWSCARPGCAPLTEPS
jgi:MscS family membrane protein